MVPARSRLIVTVTLSVGSLHPQGVESTQKISHVINVPYTLRLTAATACDATAHAAMSWQDDTGAERVIWRAPLLNNPAWTWVDTARGWFATMGNECSYSLDHAVVVYDAAGAVVRDARVAELLTPDEVTRMGWSELLGVGERAARDKELFDLVAVHRAVFFRRSRDAHASFTPGSLRIVPADDRRAQWRRDYDAMRESMFFGEAPEFNEILAVVSRFEEGFNSGRDLA